MRWILGIATVLFACGASPSFAADKKPNIILILGDDIGIPGLSCYGGVFKTRHLDQVAEQGIGARRQDAGGACRLESVRIEKPVRR